MKFKNYIETESGIKDTSTSPGAAGQVLSSTVTGTSWIDQSAIASGSTEVVEVPVKNLQGSALTKGDPVYISGSVGASGILEVQLADAGNAAKMPSVGLLKQDLAANAEGFAVVTGKLRNLVTSPIDGVTPNPNTVIYVKSGGTTGAALTTVKPTGSTNLIQNIGKVGRVSTVADGTLVVSSILRSNDIPNLTTGKIWVGDGNTTESTVVHLDETNGRMGIGQEFPSTKLEVAGNTAGALLTIKSYGGGVNDAAMRFYNENDGPAYTMGLDSSDSKFKIAYNLDGNNLTTGTKLVIDTSGNVGIGTTSPALKLEVEGGDGLLQLSTTSSTGNPYMSFNQAGSRRSFIQHADSGDYLKLASEYGGISFFTGTGGTETQKMTILSGGNVGIGTTVPSQKLDVGGNARVSGRLYTNASAGSSVGILGKAIANGWASRYDSNNANFSGFYFDGNNHSIILGRNSGGTIVNYIHASGSSYFNGGNVGIGTTIPDGKLHIDGISDSVSGLVLEASNNGDNRSIDFHNTGGGFRLGFEYDNSNINLNVVDRNRNKLFTIREGGNVGIGTTTPSYQLQLSLNSAAKPTSSLWTVVSDERVKTNIRPYKTGLQELLQVEPKLFDYNGKAGFDSSVKDNIGIIAQEIKDIMPETVKKYKAKLNELDVEETELYNFDGHAITFALINAVKELNTKIEELQNEIQTLKQNG